MKKPEPVVTFICPIVEERVAYVELVIFYCIFVYNYTGKRVA